MKLRPATTIDAFGMVRLKKSMPMYANSNGGFLLGSDLAHYQQFVQNDVVWVLADSQVCGFGIALTDRSLRGSNLMLRSDKIVWSSSPPGITNLRIAYFEQLAVAAYARVHALALSIEVIEAAFQEHDWMFTTTVREPVLNKAAWNFLGLAGFKKMGIVEEHYPNVGPIVSDIHGLSRHVYEQCKQEKSATWQRLLKIRSELRQ